MSILTNSVLLGSAVTCPLRDHGKSARGERRSVSFRGNTGEMLVRKKRVPDRPSASLHTARDKDTPCRQIIFSLLRCSFEDFTPGTRTSVHRSQRHKEAFCRVRDPMVNICPLSSEAIPGLRPGSQRHLRQRETLRGRYNEAGMDVRSANRFQKVTERAGLSAAPGRQPLTPESGNESLRQLPIVPMHPEPRPHILFSSRNGALPRMITVPDELFSKPS